MPDAWDPEQYARFAAQRREPFFDLVAMLRSRPGSRVLDLGCGSGELTWVLHRWTGAATTLGIDNSEAMLAKCALHRAPGLSFAKADIDSFGDERGFDLLFSNAALQWVEDHPALFPRLASLLAPGGQLAVQMPANDDHLSHTTAAELAREAPFAGKLAGGERRSPVLPPERYAELLHRLGFQEQSVQLKVYGHRLASKEEVVEWVKGTLLTDYRAKLGELFPAFLERYRALLLARLPDDRPFFYPYKRLLLWAGR